MHKHDYLSVRKHFHLSKGKMEKDTRVISESKQSNTGVMSPS